MIIETTQFKCCNKLWPNNLCEICKCTAVIDASGIKIYPCSKHTTLSNEEYITMSTFQSNHFYRVYFMDHGEIECAEEDLDNLNIPIKFWMQGECLKTYIDEKDIEHLILFIECVQRQIDGIETKIYKLQDILISAIYDYEEYAQIT